MRRLGILVTLMCVVAAIAPADAQEARLTGADAAEFAQARESDSPVEIVGERSETETLYANPSGTYSREISSSPIRIRKGGGWAPVDLTLEKRDGAVRPKAAPEEVELSAGGTGPVMALTTGGVDTSIGWPSALPEPVLDGPTATYPNVFTDVDLRLTVTDGGVSQVLIVKTASAAGNPALDQLRLKTDVEGGTLKSSDGGFTILDDAGRMVGESPAPAMWDSSGKVLNKDGDVVEDTDTAAIDQRSGGPAEGDDITPVDLTVSDDTLVLEPESEALAGDDVTYPVFIDPKASSSAFAWAMVFKQHPTSSFYKWTDSEGQGVGYQNYNGVSTKRLFFQHSISSVVGSQIISASFKARMNWSASCTTRSIRIYRAGAVTSDRTWNEQPAWGEYQDAKSYSAGWPGCNPSGRDVVWNVKNAVTDAVAEGRPTVAFGLRAADEGDPLTWRRFRHTTSITVEYNRKPSVPTNRTINGISCPASTVVKLGKMTSWPVMRTLVSDPDNDNVRPLYEWNTGSAMTSAKKQIIGSFVSSGSYGTRNLDVMAKNADQSIASGTWTFQIRAQDSHNVTSSYSDECTFTVDSTLAATPQILDKPEDTDPTARWETNTSYTVRFAPGVDQPAADTTGYRYAIDSDQPPTTALLPASGTDRTYAKTLSFPSPGVHVLRVWGYDTSGNRSEAPATHTFEVIDPDASARSTYTFDEEAGTDAFDATGDFPIDLATAARAIRAMFVDDDPDNPSRDGMITFNAATTTLPSASGALIDPKRSFSVAALVDPAATGAAQAMTALSIGGTNSAGVEVGAEPNGTGFDYVFRLWDVTTSAWVTARVPGDDGLPGTRPVIASYDAVTKKATLRVLGGIAPTAEAPGAVTLPASYLSQRLTLGASYDVTSRRWNGSLDHVIVAKGLLDENEITNVQNVWNRAPECVQSNGAC